MGTGNISNSLILLSCIFLINYGSGWQIKLIDCTLLKEEFIELIILKISEVG